jgi:hypothetical protein
VTRHTWSILIGAVALAIAVWCYFNFERVTEREYVGYSGEAARNPLLALQRLSERMGVRASTLSDAAELDAVPADSTLVLARGRHGMTPSRVARLLRWIEGGGYLVVEAEGVGGHDLLLDTLGVAREEAPSSGGTPSLKLPGSPREYRVELSAMKLSRAAASSLVLREGPETSLLQFHQGRGSVTVLPTFRFMRNDHIGELDNAAFAWAVLGLGAGRSKPLSHVLIAPRFERPSMLAWLAREALPALAASGALLLLWLARAARRFGPVVPQQESARRRLLDHLRASGRFQWSAHAAPRLLAAAREGCLANIAKARPALADLDPVRRSARFAELTGLAQSEVELALDGDAHTPRSFVAAVQTLQIIEEKLARRAAA